MPAWSADITVDENRARQLISSQFPELNAGSLRLLAEGWDNTVWVVDDRVAFRFPRREVAVPGFRRELGVLPRLAPLLPLPIPTPLYVGEPALGYPWPFFGSLLLPGQEVAQARPSDRDRQRLARPLGVFLRTLHSPGVLERVDGDLELPVDPMGRADMRQRVPRTRELLTQLQLLDVWSPPTKVSGWLDSAQHLPPPQTTVLAHGDLHPRHLLVEPGGRLSGVIDWGDVCRADRSIDMVLYWCLIPPGARPDFLAGYGAAGEEELLRARVLALFLCAALALYAHELVMPDLEREVIAGLGRTARD